MPFALRNIMALTTQLYRENRETDNDITKNLFSVQFESGLSESEKQLLYLRGRSHAISVCQCAHATYFVEILQEIRQLKNHQQNPSLKWTKRLLYDDKSKNPLLVGILGCGHLGSQIAHCLLTFGRLKPSQLQISTRRPDTLDCFQEKGVKCYYDNVHVVTSVHVVFLCVLPSQLSVVAEEVKGYIPAKVMMYVPAGGIPLRRLRQMFGTSSIVHPEFSWSAESKDRSWNQGVSISMALENKVMVEKTCPLSDDISDQVIIVNPRLAETFVFAALNMCSDIGLTKHEALQAIHITIFGETDQHPLQERLTLDDFEKAITVNAECFPRFDLVQVNDHESSISEKFSTSPHLRQAFIKKYWNVFEEYLQIQKRAL